MDKCTKEHLKTNCKPLPEKLRLKIIEVGTLTGSKKFGCYDPETSDIDYILPYNFDMNLLFGYTRRIYPDSVTHEPMDPQHTPITNSFYAISKKGNVYNLIIPMNLKTYKAWIFATRIMIQLMDVSPKVAEIAKTDKKKRVLLFQTFRKLFEPNNEEKENLSKLDKTFNCDVENIFKENVFRDPTYSPVPGQITDDDIPF